MENEVPGEGDRPPRRDEAARRVRREEATLLDLVRAPAAAQIPAPPKESVKAGSPLGSSAPGPDKGSDGGVEGVR